MSFFKKKKDSKESQKQQQQQQASSSNASSSSHHQQQLSQSYSPSSLRGSDSGAWGPSSSAPAPAMAKSGPPNSSSSPMAPPLHQQQPQPQLQQPGQPGPPPPGQSPQQQFYASSGSSSSLAFRGPPGQPQPQQQQPSPQGYGTSPQEFGSLQQQQQQIPGGGPPHPSGMTMSMLPPQQQQQIQHQHQQQLQQSQPPQQGQHPPPGANVQYPWSLRQISLLPAALLPGSENETQDSPPPFHRYGHSVNPVASASTGDLYIFGGLVKEEVRNDLYVLNCSPPTRNSNSMNVGLLETRGEIPCPRVGHTSVGVGNVLIIWGGDTKQSPEDVQDNGLYLLNLSTREWTLVKLTGPQPHGRYGHASAMIGSRFYIFGGQKDDGEFYGGFMNDLWSFDLQKLKDGSSSWDKIESSPNSPQPPRRMGHTIVTFGDCLYIFGGTDGRFHYNDTWCFDTNTNCWTELSCHGYIPLQREGHSSCIVDDVMYVFGGRGTDGIELDDLAAFKISNQRWYMFQNMGPAPVARSGHTMASWNKRIFVLGGESYTSNKKDDPNIVHVLDTTKIKYPPDSTPQRQPTQNSQQLQQSMSNGRLPQSDSSNINNNNNNNNNNATTTNNVDHILRSQAGSPTSQLAQRAPPPQPQQQPSPQEHQQPQINGSTSNSTIRATSPTGVVNSNSNNINIATAAAGGIPPQRPPRRPNETSPLEGSDSTSSINNHLRSGQGQIPGQNNGPNGTSPSSRSTPADQDRAISPRLTSPVSGSGTTSTSAHTTTDRALTPTSRSRGPSETGHHAYGSTSSRAQLARSPSPSSRQTTSRTSHDHDAAQHDDAFYFASSSPNLNIDSISSTAPSPSSPSSSAAHTKWLTAALALATQKGFTLPDASDKEKDDALSKSQIDSMSSDPQKKLLLESLIKVKRDLAKYRTELSEQATSYNERISEATRTRTAAQQEAAYYRTKVFALESGSASNLSKLERDRSADLERRLAMAIKSQNELEQRVAEAESSTERERQQRIAAQEREQQATQRADAVETSYSRSLTDYADLQRKNHANEAMIHSHLEQIDQLSAALERANSEHSEIKSRSEMDQESMDQYYRTLEQTQATLTAANAQADEMEGRWNQARTELQQVQSRVLELQSELDRKSNEHDEMTSKCTELERVLKVTKEEVVSMRSLTSNGLNDLISHIKKKSASSMRDIGDDHDHEDGSGDYNGSREIGGSSSSSSVHAHKLRNAENELNSLRTRHEEAKNRASTFQQELEDAHTRISQLEQQCSNFRSELASLRRIHSESVHDSETHKANLKSVNLQLRQHAREVEAAQVKANLMRSLLIDNGLAINEQDFENASNLESYGGGDAAESAAKVVQLTGKVHELEQELDKVRSSSNNNDPSRATSPEIELQNLQERHRQLEATHVKAVSYVKGTEKLVKRMKEDLHVQKERCEYLESQLNHEREQNSNNNNNSMSNGQSRDGSSKNMMGDLDSLKNQLADLRSASEKANHENEELQQRMMTLQAEYDRTLQEQETESNSQITRLKAELEQHEHERAKVTTEMNETLALNRQLNERLSSSKSTGTPQDTSKLESDLQASETLVDKLKRENSELQAKCRESEEKISLLLDAWSGRDGASASPSGYGHSPSGSQTSVPGIDTWSKIPTKAELNSATTNPSEESSIFNNSERYGSVKPPNGVHT